MHCPCNLHRYHPACLAVLKENAVRRRMAGRIDVVCQDMHDMHYPPEYFDIVISEGSVQFIGFERALVEWGSLLKQGGYLVIRADAEERQVRETQVSEYGLGLVNTAEVSVEAWVDDYVLPLSELVISSVCQRGPESELRSEVQKDARVVIEALEHPESLGSILYIIKKN